MSGKQAKPHGDLLTRRGVLEAGAAVGAAVAGAAAMGGVAFTASAEEPQADASADAAAPSAAYDTFDADVLVIGAGNNAMAAAREALAAGHAVLMVDKGPFRHGGTSGMGWDAFCPWWPVSAFDEVTTYETYPPVSGFDYTTNCPMLQNAILASPEPDMFVSFMNAGQTIPDRAEDGSIIPYMFPTGAQSGFFRHDADSLMASTGFTIMDKTMVTDLIVCDGKCAGVVALHLPTGTYRVIRAKATVMAAGSSTWMYGWLTVSARSNSTSDSTGDVDAAALRHGMGLSNAEFASYDALSIEPSGIGYGFGSGITADPGEAIFVTDKNGDHLFAEDSPVVLYGDWFSFAIEITKAVMEGRGTENGGVYVSVGDATLRPVNQRNVALLQEFGIDPRTQPIQIAPEMFEHGGTPVVDGEQMTEAAGLFNGRASSAGNSLWMSYILGSNAGRNAAKYAEENALGEIDAAAIAEAAAAEIARLEGIRCNAAEGALRPHEVRHQIQNTCYSAIVIAE